MATLRLVPFLRQLRANALRYAAGALIGGLVFYTLADLESVRYPEMIVAAARIIEREVPSGPPKLIERIRYVYLTPDVRAVAPGAVLNDVARFCRPVIVAATDTMRVPAPLVIRSVVLNPSIVPLLKLRLLVTSMDGYGDLVGEDYSVRLPLGIAAGLVEPYRTTVRYPRWAPLRELAEGALWYGAFRLVEAVVR